VAILSGFSFWQRQFCALVFPAMIIAHFFTHKKSNLKHVALSSVVFFFTISLYFIWAKTSGNYNSSFQSPLSHLYQFHLKYWLMYPGIFLLYLTCFMMPLLLLYPPAKRQLKSLWPYVLVAMSFYYIFTQGFAGFLPRHSLYRDFPFLGNVFYNAGIGPITLTDVYHEGLSGHPSWPSSVWKMWLGMLLLALPAWSRVLSKVDSKKRELHWFGILFAIIPLAVSIQAYGLEVMDRYLFPAILSMPLVIATSLPHFKFSKPQIAICFLTLSLICLFSLCGLHDYFRWNEVRWELYSKALSTGIPKTQISGGNEINGWNHYDEFISTTVRCTREDWFCIDDNYRITMNPLPNYEVIGAKMPSYWLTEGPPLYLLKKVTPQ
jgi:hypothetical protein